MNRHSSIRGQSLIEVLVGISLAAIFIIGAAVLIAPSLQIGKQTTQVQAKTELATELLDNVRAWADGNWNNVLALSTGTTNIYYLNTSISPFTISAGSGTIITTTSTATIALVQSTSTPLTGLTTITQKFASNPALNNLIVVAASWNTGAGNVTCSDSAANTYSPLTATHDTADVQSLQICYALVTKSVSSDTVKVVLPGGGNNLLAIHEYSGLATSSPLDVSKQQYSAAGCSTVNCETSLASTTLQNNDLIFGVIVDTSGGAGTIMAGTGFTQREAPQYFMTEDMAQSTAGSVSSTFTFQGTNVPYDDNMAAFKPLILTTTSTVGGSSATGTEALAQTISSGSTTYTRYFYLSDVYRDANGNVTTTVSGNSYDPSTKLITVVVQASTTPSLPTLSLSEYLTRNESDNLNQTSWAGGSGQNNAVMIVGATYASSSNISITGGAIQLSSGGGSCID